MQFSFGESTQAWAARRKREAKERKIWHRWFAWHPVQLEGVKINTHKKHYAWLTYVERQAIAQNAWGSGGFWVYRPIGSTIGG